MEKVVKTPGRMKGLRKNGALAIFFLVFEPHFEGGAAPATDVVDAQTTLLAARNGYIDAQARYKAAVAALQTITGSF